MKVIDQKITEHYALYYADCVHMLRGLPENSVGLTVGSPPFPGMYVYSKSKYDMGNVKSIREMIEQYRFAQTELLRVTMPGRNQFIHITQGVAQKGRDGFMGLRDFRGQIIDMMSDVGWNYYGEFVTDKDPQLKAVRTKDHGLMFKSLVNDSAKMHCALADIVLQFQKAGENPEPIRAGGNSKKYLDAKGWVTPEEWILWARPVWYARDYQPGTWRPDYLGDECPGGIKETETLNVSQARDTNDERHLCPLQLGVIERLILVYSNPSDVVCDKYTGVGSTGVKAIQLGRKFVGSELKGSYYRQAVRNLDKAVAERGALTLFDFQEAS